MKKILVALTFLSLLFCGSQAYALDTGNAVVTNDTIGSDSGIKAPEFVSICVHSQIKAQSIYVYKRDKFGHL